MAHATLKAWYGPHIEASYDLTGKKLEKSKKSSKKEPRHLILTSSAAGLIGVAGYSTYSPAKAALRSLTDSLVSEVNLYHGAFSQSADPPPEVKIHTVFPGNIDSPGHVNEDKIKHPVTFVLEKDDPIQTEDQVAAASVSSLEKGDYLIMTNWLGSLIRWGALSGSPRNGFGIVDLFMSGIVNLAWLFIGPDMDSTVFKWGKNNGVYGKEGRKG